MARKKPVSARGRNMKQEKTPPVNVRKVVKDERTHKITGMFLLMLAILMFIALISYCFTWKNDQALVFARGSEFLFAEDVQTENLLGRVGAWLGHKLVYQGFGLASFLLPLIPFVIGVNFIFGKRIFGIFRNIRYVLSGLIFFSVALAFLFPETEFSYGGAVGELVSEWLSQLMGKTGAGIIIFVALAAWFIWRFNPTFREPKMPNINLPVMPSTAKTVPENEESLADDAGKRNEESEEIIKLQPQVSDNGGLSVNEMYARHQGQNAQQPSPWQPAVNHTQGNSLSDEKTTPIVVVPPVPESSDLHGINMQEMDEVPHNVISVQMAPKPAPVPPQQPEENTPPPPHPSAKITPVSVRTVQASELTDALELEINRANDADESENGEPKKGTVQQLGSTLEPYDPSLELRGYKFPGIDLLNDHGNEKVVANTEELENNKNQIITTLSNYDISITKISATVGPTVTLYEIVPAPGVRISRIKNLEDDIALSLAALGIRIIAPIPGRGTIGIEVPNEQKKIVSMRGLLSSDKYLNSKYSLPIAIGKTISNEHFVVDLASMPHLLMAGATGQGKSVGINAVLVSLLYKKHPSQLKLILVDPKKVELSLYRLIEKHFLAKLPDEEEAIITDTKKVVNTLNALCIEMDTRYDLLKDAGVRHIKEYNEKFIKRRLNPEKGHMYLPFIVLVIDEFADLIMTAGKEIEMPIARLAQLARAVGIHLIIATQRPSVNIITGTIKANFPSRVAFKVSSKVDSRTILDHGGADQLIGKGDMLISHGGDLIRLQCAFVDTPEVERICEFIGNQRGYPEAFLLPEYIDEKEQESRDFDLNDRDTLFEDAARLVVQNQVGSTSLIQRRMRLGYNRAGRLMDQLEAAGIVGPNQGSKARDVLVKTESELNQIMGQ